MGLVAVSGPGSRLYNYSVDPPISELDEVQGPYSGIAAGMQDHDVYAMPIVEAGLPNTWNATDNGGPNEFSTASWWNGTQNSVRMYPPTVSDRASGMGAFILGLSSSNPITSLSLCWEQRWGSAFATTATSATPKWVIMHTTNNLANPIAGLSNGRRPMMYMTQATEFDNSSYHIPNAYVLSAGWGTTDLFGPTNYFLPDAANVGVYPQNRESCPVYIRNSTGTDGIGNPIILATEIISLEFRVVTSNAYTGLPRGYIGWRMYRRNGAVYERGTTYDWEGHTTNSEWIYEIQCFGGGYYNVGRTHNDNHYTEAGGFIRMASNYDGWVGPRTGFVS
jgi:hypothetical protein